jgi:hypothetical protein
MKKVNGKEIKFKASDMNGHAYALWEVKRIMDAQNQSVNIIAGDKKGFTIQLRVNLNKVQAERLIVKPCQEEIMDYTAIADFTNKTLRIENNAPVQSRKKVAARSEGETKAAGIPGIQ